MGGGMSVNNDDDALSDITSSSSEESPQVFINPENNSSAPKMNDMNIALDAFASLDNLPTARDKIRLQDVPIIERQLDKYEVISLIFLLQNDSAIALRDLEMYLLNKKQNLLYNWAVKSTNSGNSNWQNELVETLCCIQNYAILASFGFKKSVLESHFLPYQHLSSLHINRGRKIAYRICDSLDRIRANLFLKAVEDYFNLSTINLPYYNYDKEYLELYFLHWENIGFIRKNDFKSLKTLVKGLIELNDIYIMLSDNCANDTPVNNFHIDPQMNINRLENHERRIMNKRMSKDCESTNQALSREDLLGNLTISDSSDKDDDSCYQVDPNKPGVCLIINQQYFYTEFSRPPDKVDHLSARIGTEFDRDRLIDTFSKFRFRVLLKENVTDEDMVKEIQIVVDEFQDESSLFICILTHGEKDYLYGCNKCKVSVNKIQDIMCKRNLKLIDKPKFLILQACQGEECQKISVQLDEMDEVLETDGPSTSQRVMVPNTANLGIFWATVPGYSAVRNKNEGSWFIQSLCKKMLEEGAQRHFSDICTRIIRDVTNKKWKKTNTEVFVMTPMFITTLTKDFYLPKIQD